MYACVYVYASIYMYTSDCYLLGCESLKYGPELLINSDKI